MVTAKVHAGICGFQSEIKARSEDQRQVELEFHTECPNLKPLEEELKQVDAFKECFTKYGESPLVQMMRKYIRHAACPVPTAVLKEIEIAAKLALPQNVVIEFADEGE